MVGESSLLDWLVDHLVRSRLYITIGVAYLAGALGLAVTVLSTPFEPNSTLGVVGLVLLVTSFLVFFYIGVSSSGES